MGLNFRKSFKVGPARVNVSKSGVGYSVGAGGVRYTKSAKKKKSSESGGCFATLFKWVFISGAVIVVLGLVWKYLPWILGVAAAIGAIWLGVRIYKAVKSQDE